MNDALFQSGEGRFEPSDASPTRIPEPDGDKMDDSARLNEVVSTCKQLIAEMEAVFESDTRRIVHALSVLLFADAILDSEPDADPLVTQAAAILHDIGIRRAEELYHSAAPTYQERLGPPIARGIMEKFALPADTIDHVCRIIGSHHSARDIDTLEFRIVWDADWMVNFDDVFDMADYEKREERINAIFKTEKGKSLAQDRFLD